MSAEAQALRSALDTSPVAFAYFDSGDRLRFWNRAYEDLNFRVQDLIEEGAYIPDLLVELVLRRHLWDGVLVGLAPYGSIVKSTCSTASRAEYTIPSATAF